MVIKVTPYIFKLKHLVCCRGNSVFEEEIKDFFVPHGMCNSDSEYVNISGSPSTTDEFEDCSSSLSDKQSVIEEVINFRLFFTLHIL